MIRFLSVLSLIVLLSFACAPPHAQACTPAKAAALAQLQRAALVEAEIPVAFVSVPVATQYVQAAPVTVTNRQWSLSRTVTSYSVGDEAFAAGPVAPHRVFRTPIRTLLHRFWTRPGLSVTPLTTVSVPVSYAPVASFDPLVESVPVALPYMPPIQNLTPAAPVVQRYVPGPCPGGVCPVPVTTRGASLYGGFTIVR